MPGAKTWRDKQNTSTFQNGGEAGGEQIFATKLNTLILLKSVKTEL